MINPKDLKKLDSEEGRKELNPEFVAEFENGKGDDEEDDNKKVENKKDSKSTGGTK